MYEFTVLVTEMAGLESRGKNIEKLAEAALAQIKAQKYYAGLSGTIFCIGLAHNKKRLPYRMRNGSRLIYLQNQGWRCVHPGFQLTVKHIKALGIRSIKLHLGNQVGSILLFLALLLHKPV